MAKVTATYETMLVFNTKLGEDGVKALVEKFKSLIEANGTIDSIDDWGKRRFAYPIEDMNEGYYTVVTFKSEGNFPAELQRLMNIDESVLRSTLRNKGTNEARQMAIFLIRKLTNLSLPDIGKEFGKDHSTILYSIRKVEVALKGGNETMQNNIRDITANINSCL